MDNGTDFTIHFQSEFYYSCFVDNVIVVDLAPVNPVRSIAIVRVVHAKEMNIDVAKIMIANTVEIIDAVNH